MSDEARKPHLRAVQHDPGVDEQRVASPRRPPHHEPVEPVEHSVEETAEALADAAVAREGGSVYRPAPAAIRGLGQVASFGTASSLGTHVLAILGAAAVGAAIGGLASSSWRGAAIGAGANTSFVGFVAALLGGQRLSTAGRLSYAAVALLAAGGAGFLAWKRRR